MNDNDLAIFLLWASGTLLATTLVFSTLWLRARERSLRSTLGPKPAHEGAEIRHIVHAVDAIAVEVERISEAQRFTAQVLAEKIETESPLIKRFPGRLINPH